jgi:hypothetical protein
MRRERITILCFLRFQVEDRHLDSMLFVMLQQRNGAGNRMQTNMKNGIICFDRPRTIDLVGPLLHGLSPAGSVLVRPILFFVSAFDVGLSNRFALHIARLKYSQQPG